MPSPSLWPPSVARSALGRSIPMDIGTHGKPSSVGTGYRGLPRCGTHAYPHSRPPARPLRRSSPQPTPSPSVAWRPSQAAAMGSELFARLARSAQIPNGPTRRLVASRVESSRPCLAKAGSLGRFLVIAILFRGSPRQTGSKQRACRNW